MKIWRRYRVFLLVFVLIISFFIAKFVSNSINNNYIEHYKYTQSEICVLIKDNIKEEFVKIRNNLKMLALSNAVNELLENSVKSIRDSDKEYERSAVKSIPVGKWNTELERIYKMQIKPLVTSYYYISPDGFCLARIPWKKDRVGIDFNERPGISRIIKEQFNGAVLANKTLDKRPKTPSIALCYGHFENKKLKVISRAIIHMDDFSNKFLKNLSVYSFSIIDPSGVVVGDSNPENINNNEDNIEKRRNIGTIKTPLMIFDKIYMINMIPDTKDLNRTLLLTEYSTYFVFLALGFIFFVGLMFYNRGKELRIELIKRKEVEGSLEDSLDKLKRSKKMETLGVVAGGVAHDLNNTLASIVGYPELILRHLPEDNKKIIKYLKVMQTSGKRASDIVYDLLTLARRGVNVKNVIDVNDLIKEYSHSPEFGKVLLYYPKINVKIDTDDNLLNIFGSSIHIRKTIMNLVSNAAEAHDKGEGTITIFSRNIYLDKKIKGYNDITEGEYVLLSVIDTGMGIAKDDLDKIFEPFFTKKVMGRSGTGLGMAVVWGTVKDHNGYITVNSVEGEGTTFDLYFPATRDKIKKEKEINIENITGNGEMILIIDDIETQRDLVASMLAELKYNYITVSSGEEAVDYLKNNKVDLIISDMIMDPGIDGYETYKLIKEIHPGQKTIITSGFSESDRVKKALNIGVCKFLQKPYALSDIGSAIKTVLNKE